MLRALSILWSSWWEKFFINKARNSEVALRVLSVYFLSVPCGKKQSQRSYILFYNVILHLGRKIDFALFVSLSVLVPLWPKKQIKFAPFVVKQE